jgi:hypothetical protein
LRIRNSTGIAVIDELNPAYVSSRNGEVPFAYQLGPGRYFAQALGAGFRSRPTEFSAKEGSQVILAVDHDQRP